MPAHAISLRDLSDNPASAGNRVRDWCASLESGAVLYFPQTPVSIPSSDLEFLLGQQQSGSSLHKNIAYKPERDLITGADQKSTAREDLERLRDVMRRYSAAVSAFLGDFLTPYDRRWRLDYASFRPIEEAGRSLPFRQRNDLLHTDSFPTRPTRGWRILRFFHNIHPSRTRDWIVGEPFARVIHAFTPAKLPLPRSNSPLARAAKSAAQAAGLASLVPKWKRTPYDEFMMQLHNAMKEDAEFQDTCMREELRFAPGSSWMVYTETVPHAVMAGQHALEQTFLIDPAAMVTPGSAPISILEKMAGRKLA